MPGRLLGARARPASGSTEDGAEANLLAIAHDRVGAWFPDLDGPARVEVAALRRRPRSTLAEVTVRSGPRVHRVVVKQRRDVPAAAGATPGAPPRPGITPAPLSAPEQTALEYAALTKVADAIEPGDARLLPVRALDHLPEQHVVVLEHVAAPTGRQVLTAASRLGPVLAPAGGRALRRRAADLCGNAGRWLRVCHDACADLAELDRELDPDALSALADGMVDYLGAHLSGAAAATARSLGGALHGRSLADLPRVPGHGDFAVRNTFVDGSGRVAVIDPLPRWRTTPVEDLARFVVSIRVQGLQTHTRGAAYGRGFLDRAERQLVTGYYGDAAVPEEQLAAAELLVLLDKWCALVSQRRQRPADRAKGRWVDGYIGHEGRRLLHRLEGSR